MPLHGILDIYFRFEVSKCKFLYFAKFWNATRLETRRHGCCFGEVVAWSTGYGFWFRPWVKKWYWLYIILGVICLDSKLNGLKIAWKRISMHGPPSARVAKFTRPRKMRGPTHSARTHADTRKVSGPAQSARASLWVRGRQVRGRARTAWAAVQLCGPHWVRGPQLRGEVSGPHCPRTSPALVIQCPRNATAVPLAWAAMSRNRPAR